MAKRITTKSSEKTTKSASPAAGRKKSAARKSIIAGNKSRAGQASGKSRIVKPQQKSASKTARQSNKQVGTAPFHKTGTKDSEPNGSPRADNPQRSPRNKDPFSGKLNTVTPSEYRDQTFFEQVFEVARQIPKGRVTSYGAIAASLGARSSSRMVGWAMNLAGSAKPRVPAHRVVNRIGMLSGKHHFATPTLMQELLEKEGVKVKNDKVVDFNKLFWDPMDLGD